MGLMKKKMAAKKGVGAQNDLYAAALLLRVQVAKETNALRLVDALRLAHRRLDDERLDVLPALLEQRDEEVDRHGDVLNKLVLSQLDVADGNTEAQDLLELELDGARKLVDLLGQIVLVGDQGRELAELVRGWAEQTRDLTEERVRSNKRVVRLAKLLDLLHGLDVERRKAERVRLIDVRGITQNHDAE